MGAGSILPLTELESNGGLWVAGEVEGNEAETALETGLGIAAADAVGGTGETGCYVGGGDVGECG